MTTPADHRCRVFGSPWAGVYGTHIDSGRHYGRHWHATYGVGVLEHGAESSASGRGNERARGLIRHGAVLTQAALSCGFSDQSHMTRLFVRQFGFTPGAWQRAVRTGRLQ